MKRNSFIGRTIQSLASKNLKLTILLSFVIAGVVLLSLIPPQLLRIIIDQHLVAGNRNGLLPLAFIYLGVLVLIGIFDFIKGVALTLFGQKIIRSIRMEMTHKFEHIRTSFLTDNSTGSITSRFMNDVDAVGSLFTEGIISMFIDCFKILGIVISIWIFSGKLGILSLILIPFIYAITRAFQKRMLKAQVENLVQVGRVNNHISESLKNVHMIKSFSKESYMEKRYLDCIEDNFRTIGKVNFYDSIYAPIIQITRAAVISIIVIFSSDQLNFIGISLGMVAASIDLISNLFSPIESLGMELQNIQKGLSGIRRVDDFFMEPEDEEKSADATAENILSTGSGVAINFDNLSFAYSANIPLRDESSVQGTQVLHNLSLTVSPRESVTFIGRTGVGKSTLFKLIMGLLPPSSGHVLINGVDVYTIPHSEKRKLFGYVEQTFKFIRGTVADQITLGDSSITPDQVKDALRFVGLYETVQSFEKGMDTVVTDGSEFSQGQKQLLAIARAIAANPPILLLDEITANLDSVTEENVVHVLQKCRDGLNSLQAVECRTYESPTGQSTEIPADNYGISAKTILSISHRPSSMLSSDRIVILEDGRIRNQGSPDELIKNDTWFRNLLEIESNTWRKSD
ncbi:MAG: ABC transporter ATP-binding protein [Flexilinea sp.]